MKLDITIHKPKPRWWEIATLFACSVAILFGDVIGAWLDDHSSPPK